MSKNKQWKANYLVDGKCIEIYHINDAFILILSKECRDTNHYNETVAAFI